MMRRMNLDEVLEIIAFAMDKLTRPSLNNLLAGFDEFEHRGGQRRWVQALRSQQYLEQTGRGANAVFVLTDAARRRTARPSPDLEWERPWDGGWRVVTFDLPESRRKERYRLWQTLRGRNLGLLQRSVWIWPHDVRSLLAEIIQTEGVPECFCGFTARELFLCRDAELVTTAWPWEEINRRHQSYLKHPALHRQGIERARTMPEVIRLARVERQFYADAFVFDPLLPRVLWPRGYEGMAVQAEREQRRRWLRTRIEALTSVA